jgi:hypothetical protein
MISAVPAPVTAPGGHPSLDTRADLYNQTEPLEKIDAPEEEKIDQARISHLLWEGVQGRHRRRVICALRDPGIPGTVEQRKKRARWAYKLEDCGTTWGTWASPAGRGKVTPHHCDQQVCPRCAFHRGREKWAKYEHLTTIKDPITGEVTPKKIRLITLTQRVIEGETWGAAKSRLLSAFRRFWRDKVTRAHVTGWLRRIETTWSMKAKGWHVHCHLACEGTFWDQAEISATWARYADGEIVDVREVFKPSELFKYLIKTAHAPASKIVEYIEDSVRVRLLEFGGSWRSVEMPEEEAEEADPFFKVDAKIIREIATGKTPPEDAAWRVVIYPEIKGRSGPEVTAWAQRVNALIEEGITALARREIRRLDKEARRTGRRSVTTSHSRALPHYRDRARQPEISPSSFRARR